jgi:hypothetical protein
MKKLNLICALAVSSFLLSCGNDKKDNVSEVGSSETTVQTQTESNESSPKKEDSNNILSDANALKSAEESLRNLPNLKGKEIRVFQDIHFYDDGRIMLDIQDPDKPENIDNYVFKNGKWGSPQPVQISGEGDMKENTFPLNTLKFETIESVYKQLEEKATGIEGAKITSHIYVTLNVMHQTVRINTDIDGTRERWYGYFNVDGSLLEFKKK